MRRIVFNLSSIEKHGISVPHGGGEYAKIILARLCSDYLEKIQLSVIKYNDAIEEDWIDNIISKSKIRLFEVEDTREISAILKSEMELDHDIVYYDGNIVENADRFEYVEGIIYVGTFHGPRWMEMIPQKYAYKYFDSIIKKFKAIIKYIFRKQYIQYKKEQFCQIFDRFDYLIGDSGHSICSVKSLYPGRYDGKLRLWYAPPRHIDEIKGNGDACVEYEQKKYILMVSGNRVEKNILMGIKACDELFSTTYLKEYAVLVTGNVSNSIRKMIKNRERFNFLSYVSSSKLEELYRNCELFLYPTLNEGFGYPPMEALKYYKTCVVSAVCSLTELYGDAVYYFNPYDLNEIKTRILYAATNSISKVVIQNKLEEIFNRQSKDLKELCDFLCSVSS